MFESVKNFINGKLSGATAKNRLQMVLVQDRSGLTATEMDFFQKDLLDVIAKYFILETTGVQIEWERHSGSTALIINTPVIGRSRRAERVANS